MFALEIRSKDEGERIGALRKLAMSSIAVASLPAAAGRVKACLDKNEKSLSDKCKDALKQTGIKP